MSRGGLADTYRSYIACLNRQDWAALGQYVHDEVTHNARPLGLSGYRAMLEQDFRDIPDLRFDIELLMSDPPGIAARLKSIARRSVRSLDLPSTGSACPSPSTCSTRSEKERSGRSGR